MKKVKITPSMLASDHGNLRQEVQRVQGWGSDGLHIDVMEPEAVEDLGFTPRMAKAVQECCRLPVEYHMMLKDYRKGMLLFKGLYMEELVMQYETAREPSALLCEALLREAGNYAARVGLSFAPDTQLKGKEALLPLCSTVILMGVEPGRGGSRFQEKTIEKIKELVRIRKQMNMPQLVIAVDGGLNLENARRCIMAGADKLIIGTALFNHSNPAEMLHKIKEDKGESNDLL
ncbi:MAG: hypothetical protein OSJ60_12540 [Lachnospiraceae bacterium]|nr:hypothetical protein [Lachnospiraceae bacterium]